MIRTIPVVLLSLLSAGVLTFCAPRPATAQPAKSTTGQYVNCAQLAADVSLMVRAIGKEWGVSSVSAPTDWYSRVVLLHANTARASKDPAQYIRDLTKACLLEPA